MDVTICTVHRMSYIKWVWYHTKNWSEIITRVVVMTQIQWIQCQISGEWCHEYSACADISNVLWCHKMWMWWLIECIWCYMYSGCDAIHTKGVISSKVWVWWHRYSSCYLTKIVNVMLFTMHMMSPYIADEISWIHLVWHHQYSGCEDTDTVDMMSHIMGVMS